MIFATIPRLVHTIVVGTGFVKSVGAVFRRVPEQCSRIIVVIQGRCGCMSHYFEHALASYIGWQMENAAICVGECICSGTKYTVSWVGCP
jgi:hypothetical protein